MNKLKISKLILILLIIAAIIIGTIIIFKYTNRYINEKDIKQVLEVIKNDQQETTLDNIKVDGYEVVRNNKNP